MSPSNYTRLPGQFRGVFRRFSLWMADDHLLLVDSTRFSESYKRFYLRDIQSIIVRKTPRYRVPYYWIVLAIVAITLLLIGVQPFRGFLFWPGLVLITGEVLYLYIASMFQSCSCHLITRVTKTELPSLFRMRAALQFVERITPRLREIQGALPADWAERSAGLAESATAADQNPEAPIDLLPKAEFHWINVLAFALVLADAALTVSQLRGSNTNTWNTINLIALSVSTTYALVRLTRQKASTALRGLMLGGLLLVGGVLYASILFPSIYQQTFHMTYRNILQYPGMRQLAYFEILADAAIAIPGLILAFRLKEAP